jgi:hypothetical protein
VSNPNPGWICQVCKSPLTVFNVNGKEIVTHPPYNTEDHEPVAVQAPGQAEVSEMVCDICTSPNPVWAFPTTAHTRDVQIGSTTWEVNDDAAWSACNTCAELIDKRDLKGLVRRAIDDAPLTAARVRDFPADMREQYRRMMKRQLAELYVDFLNSINGPKALLDRGGRNAAQPT